MGEGGGGVGGGGKGGVVGEVGGKQRGFMSWKLECQGFVRGFRRVINRLIVFELFVSLGGCGCFF